MKLLKAKTWTTLVTILMIMSFFVVPAHARADWTDILGTFGIGGNSQSSYQNGQNSTYDYNSTVAQNDGDLKMTKEVKEIGQDSSYHDKIQVRSGALVEVWIEVKNTSSSTAQTTIRDELGGSMVYVKNSLRVNNQVAQAGLTSGGLRLSIPAKNKVTIIYRMNVCASSSSAIRAYAYAAGIGAATDAIIIETQNFSVGGFDETYSCISQFQNTGTNTTPTTGSTSYTATDNPFGDWTGINNSAGVTNTVNNPFGTWTGVNNSSATSAAANNPFGDWTGVNNANSSVSTASNPFGTWTGVNNSSSASAASANPFGDWTGVNNAGGANTSADPFGTWTGVNNANGSGSTNNPFGDWTGVNNSQDGYDIGGYSTNRSIVYDDSAANNAVTYADYSTNSEGVTTANTNASAGESAGTHFIAPTTGVNKSVPFVFAGILTLGFLGFRNRKLLFT